MGDKLWRSNYRKERGRFGLLRVVNYGKVNIWGNLIEGKCYLVKFIMQNQVGIFSIEWLRIIFLFLEKEICVALTKVNLCLILRQKGEGQKAFPASTVTQLHSTQNNSYVKVEYLGMACCSSPHSFTPSGFYWSSL